MGKSDFFLIIIISFSRQALKTFKRIGIDRNDLNVHKKTWNFSTQKWESEGLNNTMLTLIRTLPKGRATIALLFVSLLNNVISEKFIVKEFSDEFSWLDSEIPQFNNLVVDKNTGRVYIGAVNKLYQLSPGNLLRLTYRQTCVQRPLLGPWGRCWQAVVVLRSFM